LTLLNQISFCYAYVEVLCKNRNVIVNKQIKVSISKTNDDAERRYVTIVIIEKLSNEEHTKPIFKRLIQN